MSALYLTILGGVIAQVSTAAWIQVILSLMLQYKGEESWQDEVLEGWPTLPPPSIVCLYGIYDRTGT